MGWNTKGTGADSVGLPLLIFIPTCCWSHVDYAVHVSSWQPGGNLASCMGLASGPGPGDSLRRSRGLVLPKSANSAHKSRSRIPPK